MRFRFIPVALLLAPALAQAVPPFVEGRWLQANLNDKRVVVVDMSDDDAQYQRFHLPGAVRLPYGALLKEKKLEAPPCPAPAAGCAPAPKIPVRLDDTELAALLGKLGVTRDKYVIAYDDVGGLNAARLFWELERLGHPRVSVLDGGLVRWILDGRKVVNNAPAPSPASYELPEARRDNEATLDEVRARRADREVRLLDVRTAEEYLGEKKDPRSGHIPGARWWPWEQGIDVNNGLRRRDDDVLKRTLAQAGVSDPKAPVIAYCRTGHRAAQTYLTLRSLGYENVKVYSNSMAEYGLGDDPVKQGPKP